MLDKNFDYKPMLGRNILDLHKNAAGELVEKEPFDGPPKSDKDYGAYRSYYEGMLRSAQRDQGLTTEEGFIKFSAACEWKDEKQRTILKRATQKPEHRGCAMTFACHHCINTDPVNPEIIRHIPFERGFSDGYFLCNTCFKLLEKKKLNFMAICCKCSLCLAENLSEILKHHPDRFIDLTKL